MAKKKAKKKATTKKKISVRSAQGLKFKTTPKRGTVYQPILDQMAKLKPGKSIVLPVPRGVTVDVYQNRSNAALRRFPVKAPKGYRFSKRTTDDGKVAIMLVSNRRR